MNLDCLAAKQSFELQDIHSLIYTAYQYHDYIYLNKS